MNPIEYKITLDCRRAESQVTITAKQGEASGRKITFSLNEGRLPYKVPSGVTAVLRAKKPSGAVLYNTCTVTADGNVEYIITTQTVAEVGKLPCELQLSQDGKVIFSPNFTLLVYKNLSVDSEVESSDEFTALQAAISRAESLTDGTTFTPTVSEDGVLSWTNDGGKANPEPVNIKGEDGADGIGIQSVEQTATSAEDGGTNIITVTKTDGTSSTFTVRNGSKGSTGATGARGASGYTPLRGTDYWTADDITTIQNYVDSRINTELAGTNTLLGSGIQISFTIDGETLSAVSGETWTEWIGGYSRVVSETSGLTLYCSSHVFADEAGVYGLSLDGSTAVSCSDKIISGATYTVINLYE